MTHRRPYDPDNKREVFDELRSQILAARLKVVLDERQNRDTSPTVVRLSKLELPPIVEARYSAGDVQVDAAAWNAVDIRAGHRLKD